MDLTPKQQASEAIRQAEAILIVTGQRPNIDQVSSVVALSLILRKFGKKVTTLISDQVPNSTTFITQGQIEKGLTGLRDFILKVDLGRAEVDKLKYTIEDGKLNIHVIPFKGGFNQQDVTFGYGDYHYDLIIAMGVPSRSKLDRIFEQNTALLSSTPLLNLDFHRINESYGAINLIDTNAATLSEMLISLAESLQAGLLDEQIATAMLTGIIASTDRFTAAHTTAKSMTVAAQLMAGGAKQQTIIKALYGQRDNRESRDFPPRDNRDSRDNRDRRSDDRRTDRPVQQVQAPSPAPQAQTPNSQPVAPQVQTQPVQQPQANSFAQPRLETPVQETRPTQPPVAPTAPTDPAVSSSSQIDWNSVMPNVPNNPPKSPEPSQPTGNGQMEPGVDSDVPNQGEAQISTPPREASFNPNQA